MAGAAVRGVRLRQRGRMWPRPGARALRFEAVQEIDVRRVAFRWRARLGVGPLRPLAVVDALDGGQGRLEGRVAGVRAFRSDGPEIARGQAMRYLAELAWAPPALRLNPALEWAEADPFDADVATAARAGRAAVRLGFAPSGDLVAASAADRPRADGDAVVPTPWRGTFRDHAELGGLRVPRAGGGRLGAPRGILRLLAAPRSRPWRSSPAEVVEAREREQALRDRGVALGGRAPVALGVGRRARVVPPAAGGLGAAGLEGDAAPALGDRPLHRCPASSAARPAQARGGAVQGS